MLIALISSLVLTLLAQDDERLPGIPDRYYDQCEADNTSACLVLAQSLERLSRPSARGQAFSAYDRACDLDWDVCPEAGLGQARITEQELPYSEFIRIHNETDSTPEYIVVENLRRGCLHANTWQNEEDLLAETCIAVGALQLEGIGGGHAGNARGSFGRACRRFHNDEACVMLAELLVDRYSSDKERIAEALELYRASCRRGNHRSCDRAARITDY